MFIIKKQYGFNITLHNFVLQTMLKSISLFLVSVTHKFKFLNMVIATFKVPFKGVFYSFTWADIY